MPKGPTLYRLAADRQYELIPQHIRKNPDDLQWTDRYGSTALHILCQSRSADRRLLRAVNAILELAPEQVAWANAGGYTPLHFAVEKRLVWGGDNYSTALILRLIRTCPQAVSVRTSTGFRTKTPFHIACEADADYQVLKAMLMINPALATQPFVKRDVYSVAENPLQLLWKHHHYNNSITNYYNNINNRNTNLNHNITDHDDHTASVTATYHARGAFMTSTTTGEAVAAGGVGGVSHQTKEKMALLLQAAHYGTVMPMIPQQPQPQQPEQEDRQHHATNTLGVPVTRLTDDEVEDHMNTAISTTPQDQQQQPPPCCFRLLNAACSVRCPRDYFTQVLNESREQIDQPDEHGLYPLHYAVKNACSDSQSYTQFVVESLLEYSTIAASIPEPRTKRLPLHIAVSDTLMTWHKGAVRELVFAYPNALRQIDPMNGLVPFLASATAANKSRLHLSTTYELLLAAPEMVQPWKKDQLIRKDSKNEIRKKKSTLTSTARTEKEQGRKGTTSSSGLESSVPQAASGFSGYDCPSLCHLITTDNIDLR